MRADTLVFFSVCSCILLGIGAISLPNIPKQLFGYIGPKVEETTVLFVGDVMMARYVETLYDEEGSEYLFAGVAPLKSRYNAMIGNFEAAVPQEHTKTPDGGMQFSVRSDVATSLGSVFSALSLANNHGFDYEAAGLEGAQRVLQNSGVATFGDPRPGTAGSVYYFNHGDERVAVFGFNAVGATSSDAMVAALSAQSTTTAMQVVYIHWGDEYEPVHSEAQQRMAEALIDAGADAIIGQHPHVVQDIGWYKNVPIFYSLGNFVFDQYFNDEVQTMLAVELTIRNNDVSYRLIPFDSREYKSSPRLMSIEEKEKFLANLAEKSDARLASTIRERGLINATALLAQIENKLIMSQ